MKSELSCWRVCWPFLQNPEDTDELEGFSLQETVGHLRYRLSSRQYNVNSLTYKRGDRGKKWKNDGDMNLTEAQEVQDNYARQWRGNSG